MLHVGNNRIRSRATFRGVGMMVAQLAKLSNPSSSDPVFSAGNDNFDFQIHGYGRRDGNTFVAIRS